MSRAYRLEVEARGICVQDLARVMKRFMWPETWSAEKNGLSYYSSKGCLSGGQSEQEAHQQISRALKQINPQSMVMTRWLYTEEGAPYSEYGENVSGGANMPEPSPRESRSMDDQQTSVRTHAHTEDDERGCA